MLHRLAERRWTPWLAVVPLAALLAMQVSSIRLESATWDEPWELTAGYSYWKTGDFRLQPEHPPLGKLLVALPLLFLAPDFPLNDPAWAKGDGVDLARRFLYGNRYSPEILLGAGRAMTIAVSVALGVVIFWWARCRFGDLPALVALWLYCFDPNVVAYGRYVKNDLLTTLLVFLAMAVWDAYLTNPRRVRLVAASVLLGLALAAKFSAVFLLPAFLLLWWWRKQRRETPVRSKAFVVSVLISSGMLLACYAPQTHLLTPMTRDQHMANPGVRMLHRHINAGSPVGKMLAWVGSHLGLRAHPLLIGIAEFAAHSERGHESYLLGRHSKEGFWYYFPIAFAVKTPLATLALLLITVVLLWWKRSPPAALPLLVVPLLTFGPLVILSHVNTGVRHLLPLYPFLFILMGAVLVAHAWPMRRFLLPLLLAGVAVETLSIHPHYTAFFNRAAGGPAAGPRYLLDSNLDWGQDALKLRSWVDENRARPLCICYFGKTTLKKHNIHMNGLIPLSHETGARNAIDCYVAISATPLHGLYTSPDSFAWLRELEPVARIGYSIYVYDLRRKK